MPQNGGVPSGSDLDLMSTAASSRSASSSRWASSRPARPLRLERHRRGRARRPPATASSRLARRLDAGVGGGARASTNAPSQLRKRSTYPPSGKASRTASANTIASGGRSARRPAATSGATPTAAVGRRCSTRLPLPAARCTCRLATTPPPPPVERRRRSRASRRAGSASPVRCAIWQLWRPATSESGRRWSSETTRVWSRLAGGDQEGRPRRGGRSGRHLGPRKVERARRARRSGASARLGPGSRQRRAGLRIAVAQAPVRRRTPRARSASARRPRAARCGRPATARSAPGDRARLGAGGAEVEPQPAASSGRRSSCGRR